MIGGDVIGGDVIGGGVIGGDGDWCLRVCLSICWSVSVSVYAITHSPPERNISWSRFSCVF